MKVTAELVSRLKLFAVFIATFLLVTQSAAAVDDSYPTRPIHLILGFAAGSSGDVAARIVSNKLTELLKQTVIVENRPGASSMVATDYVARSPKDGYTLLFATIAVAINATMMPGKGPNIESDMVPIVLVGSIPNILVVHPDLNVKDVKDLIALAKQKPGELLYGASGIGSGPHLAAELFKQMAGIKMTGVLYPGSGQTVIDLISGRIQVMFSPASTVLGFIKDGRVKALATSEAQRSRVAPDLPTIAEAALPGYATGVWFGILAPAGTPATAIKKISGVTNTALKDLEVLKEFEHQGLNPLGGSPDDFAQFLKSETQRWASVIRAMDVAKKKDGAAEP